MPFTIQSDRLLLRAPGEKDDAELVNGAIRASIHEFQKWLPFAQTIPTLEETESNLKRAHELYVNRESFRYLIFLHETNTFIGTVSLQGIDWDVPKAEIGYWLHTAYTGHGYMSEAVDLVTKFGFSQFGFQRIEIRCESTNKESRAIPERLGFQLEGVLRNDDLSADGKHVTDTVVYSMLPNEIKR